MTKKIGVVVVAILLLMAVGYFAYRAGLDTPRPPAEFSWDHLQKSYGLRAASVDVVTVAEICPTGEALGGLLRGTGRVLLMGANRYYYTYSWEPRQDLKVAPAPGRPEAYDIAATVRKVDITMDPIPKTVAYVLDKSIFVNELDAAMKAVAGQMYQALLNRAAERLREKEGRELFEASIREQLYEIYAGSPIKLGAITVQFEADALPAASEFHFDGECKTSSAIGLPGTAARPAKIAAEKPSSAPYRERFLVKEWTDPRTGPRM